MDDVNLLQRAPHRVLVLRVAGHVGCPELGEEQRQQAWTPAPTLTHPVCPGAAQRSGGRVSCLGTSWQAVAEAGAGAGRRVPPAAGAAALWGRSLARRGPVTGRKK